MLSKTSLIVITNSIPLNGEHSKALLTNTRAGRGSFLTYLRPGARRDGDIKVESQEGVAINFEGSIEVACILRSRMISLILKSGHRLFFPLFWRILCRSHFFIFLSCYSGNFITNLL